uniref:Uncharacterized protein n=1 Tax=Tanacetum cinerariifolium TaxID=118510 RepID=A0A699I667_TANCI|nr:hypothetical protein [Tanacetum cinerariifolium]
MFHQEQSLTIESVIRRIMTFICVLKMDPLELHDQHITMFFLIKLDFLLMTYRSSFICCHMCIKEAQLPFLWLLLSAMPTWMSQFMKYDELMTCLMQLQAMAVELVVVAVVVLLVSLKSPSFMKRFAALCSSVEQTYD